MKDFNTAMRRSLVFGAIGAVLVPLMFECYANVSRTGAFMILAGWAVFIGVKYSLLDYKAAMLAASAGTAYTIGLGLICYIIIHKAAVAILEKNSKYFYLDWSEHLKFWVFTFLILCSAYIVMFFVWGIRYAVRQIKSNNQRVEGYIANAFGEGEDEK